MKTIYLVRHGESEGNVEFVFQTKDSPLTEKGRKQAEIIAKRIAKLPVEVIIASPAARTKATAEAIATRVNKPVEYSDLLVERRTMSELWGHRIDDLGIADIKQILFRFDEPNLRHSDEENFEDLKMRADATLSFLEKRPEEHILVVGHGLFTRVLVARVLLGERLTGAECLKILSVLRTRNTGLSVLHYKENANTGTEGPESDWQLLVWNDHAHLG
ncbi:histidine phosphatase family protein [Candidatus Kaiserbacteria bacterium]|nr:histidine phosphatase family protein [Candidatus Kaiserbacteria bacterium]